MNTYKTAGYNSIRAESMQAAAEIFATRAARRKYGRRAHCRTCCMQSHNGKGELAEFSAFIGYHTRQEPHATTGSNVHFTVYRLR